jgi:hypothetical protein
MCVCMFVGLYVHLCIELMKQFFISILVQQFFVIQQLSCFHFTLTIGISSSKVQINILFLLSYSLMMLGKWNINKCIYTCPTENYSNCNTWRFFLSGFVPLEITLLALMLWIRIYVHNINDFSILSLLNASHQDSDWFYLEGCWAFAVNSAFESIFMTSCQRCDNLV